MKRIIIFQQFLLTKNISIKNYPHFIITLLLFYMPFYSNSMTIKDIKKPIAVAWINHNEYIIGGKNGCIRGSCNEYAPLLNKKIITEERVDYVSINKNKTLLGISLISLGKPKQVLCNLEQNSVSDITFSNCFYTPMVFSTTHNFLLASRDGHLIQYDCMNNTITENKIPCAKSISSWVGLLEHHPIANKFLYKSKGKNFIIINITNPLNIEKKIMCDSYIEKAQYSPNGKFIAIKSQNDQYFICTLNTNKNHIEAHALTHDNKKYVACAFHPKESIIALLSNGAHANRAHVQYFNYITMKCIASIQTTSHEFILSTELTKNRLDICPQGKKLIAALKGECNIIDVPQNNVLDAYKWLFRKEIPTELRKYIFSLLISLLSKNMLYFDLNALLHVHSIDNIGKNENDTIESIENSEIIHVTLVGYKHPQNQILQNPWFFGHPGNFWA